MSKLHRLYAEIKQLEIEGFVKIEGDSLIVLDNAAAVTDRLLKTGPWGALLLMGALPDALKEIKRTNDQR